jgi:hypothetical protein
MSEGSLKVPCFALLVLERIPWFWCRIVSVEKPERSLYDQFRTFLKPTKMLVVRMEVPMTVSLLPCHCSSSQLYNFAPTFLNRAPKILGHL